MKTRTFLILLAVAFMIAAEQINAQTEKGKFLIGGQSSFEFNSLKSKTQYETNTVDNGKYRNIAISPECSYFFSRNIAFGLEIPFSFSKQIYDAQYTNTTSIQFIPFLIKYFGESKYKPYLMGGVGPGWGKTKSHMSSDTDYTYTSKLFTWEVGGGLAVFLNENVALDFGAGYGYSSSKNHDDFLNTDEKDIRSGIGFSIGILCFL